MPIISSPSVPSVQPFQADPRLMQQSVTSGIAAGNALPTQLSSAIRGTQEGYQTYLNQEVSRQVIQGSQIQNTRSQMELDQKLQTKQYDDMAAANKAQAESIMTTTQLESAKRVQKFQEKLRRAQDTGDPNEIAAVLTDPGNFQEAQAYAQLYPKLAGENWDKLTPENQVRLTASAGVIGQNNKLAADSAAFTELIKKINTGTQDEFRELTKAATANGLDIQRALRSGDLIKREKEDGTTVMVLQDSVPDADGNKPEIELDPDSNEYGVIAQGRTLAKSANNRRQLMKDYFDSMLVPKGGNGAPKVEKQRAGPKIDSLEPASSAPEPLLPGDTPAPAATGTPAPVDTPEPPKQRRRGNLAAAQGTLNKIDPRKIQTQEQFNTSPQVAEGFYEATGLEQSELDAAGINTTQIFDSAYREATYNSMTVPVPLTEEERRASRVEAQQTRDKLSQAIAKKDYERKAAVSPAFVEANQKGMVQYNKSVDELMGAAEGMNPIDSIVFGMKSFFGGYSDYGLMTMGARGKVNSPEEYYYRTNMGAYVRQATEAVGSIQSSANRIVGRDQRVTQSTLEAASRAEEKSAAVRAPAAQQKKNL